MPKVIARPTNTAGHAELLPWGGTQLEPSQAKDAVGHQPYGVGLPPDYRHANYLQRKLWAWLQRLTQSVVLAELSSGVVTIGGAVTNGDQRRVTINGVNVDYTTDTLIDFTNDEIARHFATAIQENATLWDQVVATSSGATILLTWKAPGVVPTLAVSVISGAGTIVISTAMSTPVIRQDDESIAQALDLVLGGPQLDDDGNAAHDARLQFRKAKGAFRAGRATGTHWDNANTGDASSALGENAKASAGGAHASGTDALASGAHAQAHGHTATASGADSGARGSGATASGDNAQAIGSSATAAGNDSVAVGLAASAGAAGSTAIGPGASTTAGATSAVALGVGTAGAAAVEGVAIQGSATGSRSVAVGRSTQATATRSLAAGYNSRATGTGATAIGVDAEASGDGALATGHGHVGANGYVKATGDGSRAHGAPDVAVESNILADGLEADAMGRGCRAQGYSSRAFGRMAHAEGDLSHATGIHSHANNKGEIAHAATQFGASGAEKGATQIGTIHVRAETTNAAATELSPNPGVVTYAWTPLDNGVYQVRVQAVAYQTAGAGVATESWDFSLTFKRIAGVITFGGSAQHVVGGLAGQTAAGNPLPGTWGAAPTLSFNQNAGDFRLVANGVAAETWRWGARVDYTRVGVA